MDGAETIREILQRSGLTKSALCTAAGVSRALLDDYLKGHTRPSLAQVARIAEACELEVEVSVREKPRPLPESFVAVLEFGELFPRKPARPLVNLGPVWREASLRNARG